MEARVEGREVDIVKGVEGAVLPGFKSEPIGPKVGEGRRKGLIEGIPLSGD